MPLASAARPATTGRELPAAPPSSGPRLRLRRVRPRHDLRASMGDAAACSVMVGMGETYFAAFALALGTGQTFAGLVATLPMLVGALLHLATPALLDRWPSYRRWVVLCVILQAAALLLMPAAIGFSGAWAAAWVFLAASAYWTAGQASSPAWNTWIEEIIPRRVRAHFFARRVRLGQLSTLAGFAVGGIALHMGHLGGWLTVAFVGIFLIASISRFVSAWFLSRQSEPSRGAHLAQPIRWRELFSPARGERGGRLVLYMLAIQTAVQISGPYFTPYILAHSGLSYFSFMVLIGLAYLGKALSSTVWGRVVRARGARQLLVIGSAAIVPVSALWIAADWFSPAPITLQVGAAVFRLPFSAQVVYLACVQLLSGTVWAAYELATPLMFLEGIPRRHRPSMLTFYNFGNAAALVTGSLIGATILQLGAESHAAYLTLFGLSSLMRLLPVLFLRHTPPRSDAPIQPRPKTIPSVEIQQAAA